MAYETGSAVGSVSRSSPGPAVPSVPAATEFEVEPEKLTEVAGIIQSQADELARRVHAQVAALRIEPPAADIVSTHAIAGWNAVLVEGDDTYYDRVVDYINGLHNLAEQLRVAGERYQASDEGAATAVAHLSPGN